jgi:hypothetical protein
LIVAAALAASLVSAIAGAKGIAECATETNESAAAFVRHNFKTTALTLYDGTHVILAESLSACLAHNAVTRVLVYAQIPGGYRLVLDDYSLPEQLAASTDGTVSVAGHETMEIVDQTIWVWNGKTYVVSPERSQRYDVSIGQGRPDVVRVRFAPGTSSTILRGSIAGAFGDNYEFDARAGQRVTIQVVKGWSKNIRFDAYQTIRGSDDTKELTSLNSASTWSGILPTSGTWHVDVFGAETMDHQTTSPYTLVLTVR